MVAMNELAHNTRTHNWHRDVFPGKSGSALPVGWARMSPGARPGIA